jgi:hypothetical protein
MSEYLEIPGFENITHENVKMFDVVEYLNSVLKIYGPPCEWCEHFDMFCSKKFRPRQRLLKFGPFEFWHLRKHCEKFKEKEESKEGCDKEIERYVRNSLNCDAQTYG